MAKKFPDHIFITREKDQDTYYFSAREETPTDGRDWNEFAVYQRIGTGRARDKVEQEIKIEQKKVRVRKS